MQKLATRKEEPIARPSTAFPPSDAALPASSLSLSQLGLNYIEGGALLGGGLGSSQTPSTLSGLMLAGGNFRNPRRFELRSVSLR